jgi:hypothetical protein
MSEPVPPIMLEELYGEDFEHELLDRLLRVARSYLELAIDETASVADRARSMGAAYQLLDLASVESLHRDAAPLKEPWDVGIIEGHRAAAMVMRSLDPPGWAAESALGDFELSLHGPDGTEVSGGDYKRQAVRFVPTEPDATEWTNENDVLFHGLPQCVVKRVYTWWRGRTLHEFDTTETLVVHGDSVGWKAGFFILRA